MLEKQLQIDLQDSDKYALVGGLFGIIDSAMDAVITINEAQRILLFNPAAEQMFGCKSAEVLGSRVDRFIPERFRKAHEGHIRKFGETGQTSRKMGQLGEISGLRTNGEEFPIEASISQVQVGGKKLFSVILRDITERKRNEDALRERVKELTCLYAVSHDIQEDLPGDELYRRAVGYLVQAMRFPEIAVAVIELNGKRFTSENYTEGLSHGLHAEIRIKGKAVGHLRVYYAQEKPFLIPEEQNLVNGVAGAISTWLERKGAEESLRESEIKYRTVADNTYDWEFWLDPEGRFIYCSPSCERTTRHKAEEFLADSGLRLRIIHPDDRPIIEKHIREVEHKQQAGVEAEWRYARPDGTTCWIAHICQPVYDNSGRFIGTRCSNYDITERKRAEEMLRKSEEQARWLAKFPEENPDMVLRVSLDGTVLYCNPAAARQGAWKCDIGQPLQQEPLRRLADDAVAQNRGIEQEVELEGTYYSVVVAPAPAEGYVNIYGRDITKRKHAEQALRESQARLALAADAAKIGIFDWRIHTGELYWTTQTERIFGLTTTTTTAATAYTYKDWADRVHPEDLPRIEEQISKAMDEGTAFDVEYRIIWPDKSIHWLTARALFHYDDLGQATRMLGVAMDITERRRVEEALRQSEIKYRTVADNTYDWEFWLDPEGRFIYCSPSCERMTGHKPKEFLADPGLRTRLMHPDDCPRLEQHIREVEHKQQAGVEAEWRYVRPDGTSCWVAHICQPVYDDSGRFIGTRCSNYDITGRKKADEQRQQLTEELKRSNTELEEFADMVSHDLRAPLRSITGFMGLFHERYKDKFDEKAREYVNSAINGGQRMEHMLTGLLEYSRVKTRAKGFASVSMQTVLKDAIDNLHTTIAESRAAVTCDELPAVRGDVSQLTQLFQNLIQNAIKFRTDKRPEIRIGCKRQENAWLFSVRDNGIGIDPRFHDHIFTIFHKVHPKDERAGEGVGLAVCRRIVERHSGKIWVESKEGKGATFYFTIPVEV